MSLSISPAKLCHFMLHFFLFLNFIISLFHPDSMQMDSLFIWSFTKRTFSNIFLTKIFHKMYFFFFFFHFCKVHGVSSLHCSSGFRNILTWKPRAWHRNDSFRLVKKQVTHTILLCCNWHVQCSTSKHLKQNGKFNLDGGYFTALLVMSFRPKILFLW